MNSEEAEQKRLAILKQREKSATKRQNLPYLVPGMSPRARALEISRAANREKVRQRILKAWEDERRAWQPDIDPAEGAAHALLGALDSGGDQKQRAAQFLKTAHPRIKEKLLELAGANSEWKERRSNKPNGF